MSGSPSNPRYLGQGQSTRLAHNIKPKVPVEDTAFHGLTPSTTSPTMSYEAPGYDHHYSFPESSSPSKRQRLDGSVASTKAKRFRCTICSPSTTKLFGSSADLVRHKKSVHRLLRPDDKLWFCPVSDCITKDKQWARLDNLKQHVKNLHSWYDLNNHDPQYKLVDATQSNSRELSPHRESSQRAATSLQVLNDANGCHDDAQEYASNTPSLQQMGGGTQTTGWSSLSVARLTRPSKQPRRSATRRSLQPKITTAYHDDDGNCPMQASSPFEEQFDLLDSQASVENFEDELSGQARPLTDAEIAVGTFIGKVVHQKYIRSQNDASSIPADGNDRSTQRTRSTARRPRQSRVQQPRRRKQASNGFDDQYDGDESPGEEQGGNAKQPPDDDAQAVGDNLACPFYVKYPAHCSSRNRGHPSYQRYHNCGQATLRDRNALRIHLGRIHRRPLYYCSRRCYRVFRDLEEERDHTDRRRCSLRDNPFIPGTMTSRQWQQILQIGQANDEEYWHRVWLILFPEVPLPHTVFSTTMEDQDISILLHVFRRIGPTVSSELYSDLQNPFHLMPLPPLHRGIVEYAYQTFLAETRQPDPVDLGFDSNMLTAFMDRTMPDGFHFQPPGPANFRQNTPSGTTFTYDSTLYGSQPFSMEHQWANSFGNNANTLNTNQSNSQGSNQILMPAANIADHLGTQFAIPLVPSSPGSLLEEHDALFAALAERDQNPHLRHGAGNEDRYS